MGCGCVTAVIAVIAATIFFIYASTDPGPPVEGTVLVAIALGIIYGYRALGVPRIARG